MLQSSSFFLGKKKDCFCPAAAGANLEQRASSMEKCLRAHCSTPKMRKRLHMHTLPTLRMLTADGRVFRSSVRKVVLESRSSRNTDIR